MSESTLEFQEPPLGPGARLQQARLQKKLSLEAVADQLHLSKHQIEAIENNNFTYISSLAYVRGHLRMYARIVDLPVNEIVKAFDSLDLKPAIPPASPPPLAVKTKMQLEKQKAKSPRWWLALIVVLIIILLGLVLRHSHQQDAAIATPAATPLSTATPAADSPIILQPQPNTNISPMNNDSSSGEVPLAIPPDKPVQNSQPAASTAPQVAPPDANSAE